MIKWLRLLFYTYFFCEAGGLGITQGSLVSAISDNTGDDSMDAVVKIKRLINTYGPDFCLITNWPFLREDITFSITSAAYKYSGTGYLPATFRKALGAHITDSNDWHPIDEVGIKETHTIWLNPANNSGRPDKFAVTRIESGFWEIQFDRIPDSDYTVTMDVEKQWVDLTATGDETVVTKEYLSALTHYLSMMRFLQQGDSENYQFYKAEWWDHLKPTNSMLGRILHALSGPAKQKSVIVREKYLFPLGHRDDYRTSDYKSSNVYPGGHGL